MSRRNRSDLARWMLCLATAAGLLVGCSTFGSRSQELRIDSRPVGAEVLVDGSLVGTTPLVHRVRRQDPVTIIVRKPGYMLETQTTRRRHSGLGKADLIGGFMFWPAFLGLLSGAAYEHDPDRFLFVLTPWVEEAPEGAGPAGEMPAGAPGSAAAEAPEGLPDLTPASAPIPAGSSTSDSSQASPD